MTEIDEKSLSLWEALHRKWYNTIQSINLDGTLVDDANISELLDIEKEIWSLILEFKEADVELPESMKTFKPFKVLWEERKIKPSKRISLENENNNQVIEIEDWNGALYSLADELRMGFDQGDYPWAKSYMDVFRWAETKYTYNGGHEVKAGRLVSAWHKAKADNKVG